MIAALNFSSPVRHTSVRRTLGLLLLVALTACSAGGTGGAVAPRSAEQVHAAWIMALRFNNREQALALLADMEFKTAEVDGALDMVRREMRRAGGNGETGGNLAVVQPVRMEDQGNGKQAWSSWTYAGQTFCHRTDLSQTPAGWRVTAFNLGNDDDCQP